MTPPPHPRRPTPQAPQQEHPHVRWFGRSEDDPNRLLIIEDEHSRVSLDADLRQELYSAIGSARPLSPAPASTSYEQPKCFGKNNPDIFDCENCGDREYCIDITEASRAAADAAVKERDQQIIAAFDKEDADGFANMVRAKEIVKSLRRAPQQEQKPKIVFHPKENNWHRGR